MQKFGIDLSNHNEGINFDTLKNEGVEFAILRAGYTGYGNGVSKEKDYEFENFYNQCKAKGIGVGAYWFTCANTYQKGVDEANWMYDNCLRGKQFDYPIYIDVEDDTGGRGWLKNAGKEAITDGIIGFCETLENKGYYVGIYANLDWFNNWINQNRVKDYDKWLACWSVNKPSTYLADRMWQFGGEENHIRSPWMAGQCVDQDYCYYDYPSIIKNGGFNGYEGGHEPIPQPEPEPTPQPINPGLRFKIGDHVIVNGDLYISSNAEFATGYVNNKITYITRVAEGAAHPYNTTGDLGWMNENSIQYYNNNNNNELNIGDNVKIISTGNGASDGSANTAYGIGENAKVLKIWNGRAYPYQIGNDSYTIGFYKKDALEKI